jgi:hypothetical protein
MHPSDFDFDDDYLGAFAEAAFAELFSRYHVPSHHVALKRGWSPLVGNTAGASTPRGGAPWTDAEERDLLVAAAGKINLTKLAKMHGRTEHAIACRLEVLGVDRTLVVASDFEAVPPERQSSTLAAMAGGPKPRVRLSPESRLRTLLTIALRAPGELPPQDLAFLDLEDLIHYPNGRHGFPELTERGRASVDLAVGRVTAKPRASVLWDAARQTSVLDDGAFFLVASGDVYKECGPHGRPGLKNPPKVVQTDRTADAEALRLARENPGTKFFVLQAVAVHVVTPPKPSAASSKRL